MGKRNTPARPKGWPISIYLTSEDHQELSVLATLGGVSSPVAAKRLIMAGIARAKKARTKAGS